MPNFKRYNWLISPEAFLLCKFSAARTKCIILESLILILRES